MFRILFLLVVVGILLYLSRDLLPSLGIGACPQCKGKGFWEGTRGERNVCEVCGGSGKRNSRN